MIAFDCPHCNKPLIVPTKKAGSQDTCPGCRQAVVVPLPARPSCAVRHGKLLAWVAVLLLASLGVGYKIYRDREPERIKSQVAAALQAHSSQWQGFDWEQCDLQTGDFRFRVFYLGPRKRYQFAVACFTPADQTIVTVDPTANQSDALATLIFTAGATESFRYAGGTEEEKEELEALCERVARLVRHSAP